MASLKISWFDTEPERTYDIRRSIDNGNTWSVIAEDVQEKEFLDENGDVRYLYSVSVHGSNLWTPAFYGSLQNAPTCKVFGYVFDTNGSPKSSSNIFIHSKTRQHIDGGYLATQSVISTTTDETGYFELHLPKETTLNIRIPDANIDVDVKIPNTTEAPLVSLE